MGFTSRRNWETEVMIRNYVAMQSLSNGTIFPWFGNSFFAFYANEDVLGEKCLR